MVVADRAGDHARYRLLETLRQFGEERLDEPPKPVSYATATSATTSAWPTRPAATTKAAPKRPARRRSAPSGPTSGPRSNGRSHRRIKPQQPASSTPSSSSPIWRSGTSSEIGPAKLLTAPLATPTTYGIAAVFAAMRGDYDHALSLTETGLAAAKSRTDAGDLGVLVQPPWAPTGTSDAERKHGPQGKPCCQIIDPAREPFKASVIAAFSAVMAATGADPDSAEELLAHTQRLAAPLDNPALDAVVAYATGAVARSEGHYESAATTSSGPSPSPSAAATSSCRASFRCPRRSWP